MMTVNLHWLDYSVIGIYFLIVFGIGFFVNRHPKPVGLDRDASLAMTEYFLAGRRITLPIFVATLVSTWYGNLLGISELAYKQGIVAWLTQGVFWYLIYIFFAFFIVPKVRAHKLFTIPDIMENFYGRKSAIATAVVNVIMLNPALYILSMGIMCEIIFGIDPFTGILVGTLVPLLYTLKGGFKAVVYTDFVQFLFMFIGVALVVPFALIKHGGLEVLSKVPESHFNLTGTGEWSWQVILSWALISFWAIIDTNFYQRTYAAESDKTAKHGILWATVFWLIFDMMINFIGLYAFAVSPDLDPARSLPLFANSVLPPLAKGIFFTGLIATIMSTFDSLIFASAMSVSKDIYQKLGGDERKVIWINKLAIVGTVLVAFLIALKFKSLINLIYARGSIGISALLLPMLLGFFSKKKFSDLSIVISISLGALTALTIFLLNQFYGFNLPEPIICGLLVSGLSIGVLRVLKKN